MRAIVHEATYPHPVERVWRALTDPAALAAWLMENDFAPTVGHHFTLRGEPAPGFGPVVHGEVLEAEAPRRLVYAWRGAVDSRVSWTLAPATSTAGRPAATRLRLEHDGFRGLRGYMARSVFERGWKATLLRASLPAVLDRMRDEGGDG